MSSGHAVASHGLASPSASLRHASKASAEHAHQLHVQQKEHKHAALVRLLREELGPEVDAKLRQGGEEGLTDQTLRRWLVARKWVYEEARQDLAAHAEWRVKYMPPGGRITEDDKYVKENIAEDKVFMQGLDNAGHPILMCYGSRHLPKTLESSTRWVCYILDAVDRLGRMVEGWDGKSIGIICLTGLTIKNADLNAGRALFPSLQAHFPERLHTLFLYDAPLIFLWLWKLTQPFLDPVTARKVVFVYPNKSGSKELAETVSKELLPPELGGTGRRRPIQEAWKLILEGNVNAFRPHGGAADVGTAAGATTVAVAAGAAGPAEAAGAAGAAGGATAAVAAADAAAAAGAPTEVAEKAVAAAAVATAAGAAPLAAGPKAGVVKEDTFPSGRANGADLGVHVVH